MSFGILLEWCAPQDHSLGHYFYITKIKEISSKSKCTVKYPIVAWPVPYSENLPVPHPPTELNIGDDLEDPNTQDNELKKSIFEEVHLPENLIF